MRLPVRLHAWLRSMRTTRLQLVSQLIGPTELLRYLPYRSGAATFLVPKGSRTGQEGEGLPVPPKGLWVGYGQTVEQYLASGERDIHKMLEILAAAGTPLEEGERVLDFGCAAGRMLRWLEPWAERGELWGTDISAEHIVWCQQQLNPPFRFLTSTTLPHLPFEDRYFDLIYAGSVFTHIDDLADAWLLELGRILAPGGRAFLTIHDRSTIELLERQRHEWLSRALLPNRKYRRYVRSDFAMFTIGRGPSAQVFFDLEYFCRMLEPTFEVLAVVPEAYSFQTGIVARRRAE